MKIRIVSDLTLDAMVQVLRGNLPEADIRFDYADNLSLFLISNQQELKQSDYLIVHSDTYFSANVEQDELLLQTLLDAFNQWNGVVLIPSRYNAFSVQPLKQDSGRGHGLDSETEQKLHTSSNIYQYDFQHRLNEIGLKKAYHFGLGHLYQMPYTKEAQQALAECWTEYLRFLSREEKKVVVLDCDNTLWGGILGEDGEDGIKVDKNADGILYLHFQEFLKQKKQEGFLLCLCSKNNEEEVKHAFENRSMPLRWDDFVVRKVSWADKYISMHEIASELNLGLSSMVFIDDSEFETNSIRELLPEVEVITFKKDYNHFRNMTGKMVFRRKKILDEDRRKTEAYQVEQQRKQAETTAAGFDDFVKNLQIVADFTLNDETHIERLAQLTEKTNQFNFNKVPYSVNALQDFMADGSVLISAEVRDKFGEYGIVGLMLVKKIDEKQALLHNFLMSCRALGRGVEQLFLERLKTWLDENHLQLVGTEFKKTEKNAPAELFLPEIKKAFKLD